MQTYRYLIGGGGLAGGKAVEGIREQDKEGTIALVTAEPHRPYQRPPLSKGYLRGECPEDVVYVAKPDDYDDKHVELLIGVHATVLDPTAHTLTLEDGHVLGYEKLLLATGGRAKRLPLPGSDLPGVFTLRTIEDADAVRDAATGGATALVLGGSFIGSEVAASLAMIDTDVTMAFPEGRLLERLVPEKMSAWLHALYAQRNVRILPGVTPARFLGGVHVQRVELSSGAVPKIDLAVMGVGITLNTELAQEAGLDIRDQDNAVLVDGQLRTSHPDIYAAGDIAAWPDTTFNKRLRVEHWDVARAQGLHAGRNMAGAAQAYTTPPYFFSDLFDLSFEVWGDLSAWDQTVARGSLEDRTIAYYYFADGKLTGVLAMGRPEAEREPMQALVKARPAYDDVADHFADQSTDLQDLL